MNHFQRALLFLAAFAPVAAACTGGGDAVQPDRAPTVNPAYIVTSGLPDPSERQLEMVADGEATFTEYEEAFFAYIRCIGDAGIELRGEPKLDAHGLYYEGYQLRLGITREEAEANQLKAGACEEMHLLSVFYLWNQANQPSESMVQAAIGAFRSCLTAEGIEAPPHLSVDELAALLNVAASGGELPVPPHLSLDDIASLMEEFPDASVLLPVLVRCRDETAEQYPVGW